MEALTDEQLIDQMKIGKTEAIDELYRRYSKKLYAFCGNIVPAEDPEDMVHDIFMRVIKSAVRFNPKKSSFNTWLFRIARNHCIDAIRRASKIRFVFLDGVRDTLVDDTNVEDLVVKDSLIAKVRECIGELKEQERAAIILYYIGGKVYREIGKILGKSISMVKNRIKSAQNKVKICLERKGISSFS